MEPNENFKRHSLIDCGSDDTLVPLHFIPDRYHDRIRKTSNTLRGVGACPIDIYGYLKCDISIGSGKWYGISVSVMERDIPILLGNNILRHPTVASYTVSADSVRFNRTGRKGEYSHTVPIVPKGHSFLTLTLPPDLRSKVNHLTSTKKVTLPTNVSNDQLRKVVNLLDEFDDIFATDDSPIGTFPGSVRIHTVEGKACAVKQHPIQEAYRAKVDAEIDKMLEQGVVEPCSDPKGWNTPLHVVPKKNGDLRIVANFKRTVNKLLTSQADFAWQMPSCDEVFNEIGRGNTYFSSIDLKSGYWQIQVDEQDRHKFAFQWRNRTYQYCRVPFGWTIAGQTFSRCVGKALENVQNQENFKVYVDDVLVHSKTFDDQLSTLRQVFTALKTYGLKLNAKKCTFLQPEAEFLGRVVDPTGFRASPSNVQAIQDLRPPTSKSELMSVIGQTVWLRQFIDTRLGERVRTKAFSSLLSELNKLNRKDRDFEWPKPADDAFNVVKERLKTAPVISFADFKLPFVLVTDASEIACGAVLLQQHEGKEKVVAVASSTFNPTEQRWCATERECYALIWAMEKFQYFLRGRTFLVQTDHKSLIYLDKTTFKNAKIQRWQERMAEFNFVVEYLEGSANVFADLLSRPNGVKKSVLPKTDTAAGEFKRIGSSKLLVYIPSWVKDQVKDLQLMPASPNLNHLAQCFNATRCPRTVGKRISDFSNVAKDQRDDPFLSKVIQTLEKKKCLRDNLDPKDHRSKSFAKNAERFYMDPFTGALMIQSKPVDQIVVPDELRAHFLYQAHDNTAHAGRNRAIRALERYWWPCKTDDVYHYVDTCLHCARRKGNYGVPSKPGIGHVMRGQRPFEVVYIDFVHLQPGIGGKKYICTILDSFSRYLITVPTCRDRAVDAVNAILFELCLKFDTIPKVLSSDRGTHFNNAVMAEVCEKFGIKQQLHVAWRPQSSGSIERAHRTLKNALFATCSEKLCDWTEALPFVTNAINSSYNSSIKASPREVIFGEKSTFRLPEVTGEQMRSSSQRSYGYNLRTIRERVHQLVTISAEATDREVENRNRRRQNPVEITLTDQVLLNRPQSAEAKRSKMNWIGPFQVCATNGRIVRIIDSNGSKDWVHREDCRIVQPRRKELDRNVEDLLSDPICLEDLLPIRGPQDSPNVPVQPKTGEQKVEVSAKTVPKTSKPEIKPKAAPKPPRVPPPKRDPPPRPVRRSTRTSAQPHRYTDSDYRKTKL